jgi:methylmalonyl-CoA epimerase
MTQRIDHIGIAVKDVDEALAVYRGVFGLEAATTIIFDEMMVKMAIIPAGEIQIHFLAPTEPGKGPIGEFLAERGEGFHHIGLEVESLEGTLRTFELKNLPVRDKVPIEVDGFRVAFNEPLGTQNVLFELIEKIL